MKISAFFKGLTSLILLNLLVKPVWMFFIDRQVQNIVGHEEYGKYFAVLNLSYVLFFLSDAGLANMINQRIANGKQLNVPQIFRFKFFLILSYITITCLVGWLTGITQWGYLVYVLLIQVFTSIFILFRNILTGNQFFQVDAWLSVIDKSLMVIFCGAILYTTFFGSMDLLVFLQVQAMCSLIAMLAASVMVFQKHLVTKKDSLPSLQIIKMILPFAVIILLMSVHYRLDGFLLERIHTEGALEAGIYASAYRLLDASNMAGYLTSSFLVAFIARHQHDKAFLEQAVINTRHGLFYLVIGIISFTVIFASWLQNLLYHSSDPHQEDVIRYCMISLGGYFLVHIYGSVLTATGKFRSYISILIVSVGINVLLNLLLIPHLGALACCYAAIVSQYLCGFACMINASRQFRLDLHVKSLLGYGLLAGILTGFFYFARAAGWNVFICVLIAALLTVLVLLTQLRKKFFRSLH